jgi:non-ribosomal peptide synthetase component F/acyl carrier protein
VQPPIPSTDLDHHGTARTAPLSSAQRRLWFLTLAIDEPALHLCAVAVRLIGAVDVVVLRGALRRLMERHAILRTRFIVEDDTPTQRIEPTPVVDCQIVDLSHTPGDDAVQAELDSELRQGFDLSQLPLLRVRLLVRRQNEYVLSLVAHHIVIDMESLDVLRRDLEALYASELTATSSSLPPLAMQYADYAVEEERTAQGGAADALAFWEEGLRGARTVDLPADRVRGVSRNYRGGSVGIVLAHELAARVRQLGVRERATPAMTMQAAFSALLARWSRRDDILLGTVASTRQRVALESLIGPFANDLLIRIDLRGNPTFKELIRRVRDVCLRAYRHQHVPFDVVIDGLSRKGIDSRALVSNVMYGFRREARRQRSDARPPSRNAALPALWCWTRAAAQEADARQGAAEWLQRNSGVAGWDLKLNVIERQRTFLCAFQYSADLFEEWRIRQLASQYVELLADATSRPDLAIWRLSLTAGLRTTPPTPADADAAGAEHPMARFEKAVARTPTANAVITASGVVTYLEVQRRSGRIAAFLTRAGVRAEDVVCLVAGRTPDAVAALLGVWKAGVAVAWIDPDRGTVECRTIVEAVRPTLVLTASPLAFETGVPVASLDRAELMDGDRGEIAGAQVPVPPRHDSSAAYVAHTAGVSGAARAVVGTYRGLAHACDVLDGNGRLRRDHRVIAASAIGTDLAIIEVLWTLASGASVLMTSAAELRGDALQPWIHQADIVVHGRTRACEALRDAATAARSVRSYSGREIATDRSARHGGCSLFGATEAAGWSAILTRDGAPVTQHWPDVHLLDRCLQPVPVGLTGDFYVGGPALARGYLGSPGETAAAFVADPFCRGARMFQTGDCGRWRPDGTLEILGRERDVEAGITAAELIEVERTVRACGAFTDVAAAVAQGADGQTSVIVAIAGDVPVGPGELQRMLARALPKRLVPTRLVPVGVLPRTAAGALDTRALVAATARVTADLAAAGFASETERTVARMWSEFLDIPPIDGDADFFDVGGHSLAAMRFLTKAARVFGVELDIEEFLDAPRLSQVARTIDAKASEQLAACTASATARGPRAPVVPRPALIPTSFEQRQLWFLDRLSGGSAHYHMPLTLPLDGTLNEHALRRALATLFARHEALRTRFTEMAGEPFQIVEPPSQPPLAYVDLSAEAPERRPSRVRDEIAAERLRPFDLLESPPIRLLLIKVTNSRHLLVRTAHHIVCDGWSDAIFRRELDALYRAYADDRDDPLPTLLVQYADYAIWQRARLSGDVLESEVAHGCRLLDGIPPATTLPAARPRPPRQTFGGRLHRMSLNASRSDAIRRLCREHQVTPFMVLFAAFALVLSRYNGQDDLAIGTPMANRPTPETEAAIGFFVNTVVLRTTLSPRQTFRELLAAVRRATLDAHVHQDVPFDAIVERLAPPRRLDRTPLFQIIFGMQNVPEAAPDAAALESAMPHASLNARPPVASQPARFDLEVTAWEHDSAFGLAWLYNEDLFDPPWIAQLASHYARALEIAVGDADRELSRFDLLSTEERVALLPAPGGLDVESDRGFLELFARQVRRGPGSPAVTSPDEQWDYRALDLASSRVQRHLLDDGVTAEDMVAVALPSSPACIAAIIAVLRAGATCLLIDLSEPAARIAALLASTRTRLVLTNAQAVRILPPGTHALHADQILEGPENRGDVPGVASLCGDQAACAIARPSTETARPEIVVIPHRALAASVVAFAGIARLTFADRLLALAPVTTGEGLLDALGALAAGACLVLPDADDVVHPETLGALLQRSATTVLRVTPPVLRGLARAGTSASGLRILVGPGPIAVDDVEHAARVGTQVATWHGATEVGGCSLATALLSGRRAIVPVGRPVNGAKVYILDAALRPVPRGVVGDMYLAGATLARGYFDRPALTGSRFVADPFGVPGARMFVTAARGRWTSADGECEIVASEGVEWDDTLRVEAALRRCTDVEDVAMTRAAAVDDTEPGMVAHVVSRGGAGWEPQRIRRELSGYLPTHLVPPTLIKAPSLPLRSDLRLDRGRLAATPIAQAADREPSTDTERLVLDIWNQLLPRRPSGVHDDFFALGGHSLLVMRMIARVDETFGVSLGLAAFFERPTVAEAAAAIEAEVLEQIQEMTEEDAIRSLTGKDPAV